MNNNFWTWCIVVIVSLIAWQVLEEKNKEINSLMVQQTKLVDEINKKVDEHNKFVEEARNEIAAANRPEATVIVNFRKGFVDNGDVAIFSNISGRTTVITAEIARPSSGKTKSFELAFDRGTTRNLGESEGWAFLSGDTVTIHQDGHKSLTYANR